MKRCLASLTLATCLALPARALAEEPHATAPDAPDAHASTSAAGRPVLPRDAAWAGVMVIVIVGGFFLPAAVIGPIARALAPEDEPETTSHDEHGGSHNHPTDAHAPHDAHGQRH